MTATNVLVVEDEGIVAIDIKSTLTRLGYHVAGVVATGEDAVEAANRLDPEIVLMDIRLEGEMDGVEAAHRIREATDRPVVFLTAYTDEDTLHRAKVAEPFGYILKPFEERDLKTVIEVALYKHEMEARLRRKEALVSTILASLYDAVIGLDSEARVTFMNHQASRLTGWDAADASGMPIASVCVAGKASQENWLTDAVERVTRTRTITAIPPGARVTSRAGRNVTVEGTIAPLAADGEHGVVVVLSDVSAKLRLQALEDEIQVLKRKLDDRARDLV